MPIKFNLIEKELSVYDNCHASNYSYRLCCVTRDISKLIYYIIKCTVASYISPVTYYLSLCEIRNCVRELSPVLQDERPHVYLAGPASEQSDDRREK